MDLLTLRRTKAGNPRLFWVQQTRHSAHRHAGLRKGLLILTGILAGIFALILIFGVVLFVTKGSFIKGTVENIASARTGRTVVIDGPFRLYPDPHIRLHAEGISISNPDWAQADQFFQADLVDARLDLWKLLGGNLTFRLLRLDQSRLELERDAENRKTWVFDETAPPAAIDIPVMYDGRITRSTVRFRDAAADFGLTFRIAGFESDREGARGPLTLEGNGRVRRGDFKLQGVIHQPRDFFRQEPSQIELAIQAAGSAVRITGLLPSTSSLDEADLTISLSGRSLDEPFALIGVVLSPSRPYKLDGDLKIEDASAHIENLRGRIGDSDIAGRLSITWLEDERLFLDADLESKALHIIDIGPIIGIPPEQLEKTDKKPAPAEGAAPPRVLPKAPLEVKGLERYDARLRYRAASIRAPGLPLEDVRLNLTLDDRKLTLDPVAIDLAKGRAVGRITINARQAPIVTDYDIDLRDLRMSSFLKEAGLGGSDTSGIIRGRVDLVGEGPTVRQSLASADGRIALIIPQGELKLIAAHLAELDFGNLLLSLLGNSDKSTRIRCGLIAFTVKDGIAEADPILISTEETELMATGKVSFKDESLDLDFRGLSKDFSLVAGQSPIKIGGYFAAPVINPISGELAARTGAAVALGLLATPLAALAAFIDLGDQEKAACEPLLKGLPAAAEKRAREEREQREKQEKKGKKEK